MKRTAGCTGNQGNWHWANWQHVFYISWNIECTITEARHYSSDLPQGGLEVPCTLHFSGDAKLGKSYKLSTSKNINIDGI